MMASEADVIEDNWVRTVSLKCNGRCTNAALSRKCADSINRHPQSHDAWFTEDIDRNAKNRGLKSARPKIWTIAVCSHARHRIF